MTRKKRYHSSKRVGNGFYEGMDVRRRQERTDANMVSEDRSAVANLPQNVVMRQYPEAGYARYPYLDDTIKGINRQMNDDSGKEKKREYPEKY